MSYDNSVEFIHRFLEHNFFDKATFVRDVGSVLNKTSGKINTIIFMGPSNVGKTHIANSLKYGFRSYCNISWMEGGQ